MISGTWTPDKKSSGSSRKHASMRLNCYNCFGDISHTRRCNACNKAQRKSNASRQVADDQYAFRDPSDTPEGAMCGIVSSFACGTTLTTGSSVRVMMRIMKLALKEKLQPIGDLCFDAKGNVKPPDESTNDYLVRLDGGFLWRTKDPKAVINFVRKLRQRGGCDAHMSCELEDRYLSIRLMAGRIVRPLLNLKNWFKFLKDKGHPLHRRNTWDYQDLADLGIIEFFDGLELRSTVVAFSIDDFKTRSELGERFTHMEVDQAWCLGVTSASFPFADRNQGPRAVLAASMLKQAFTNVENPLKHVLSRQTLHYPQRSPCETRVWKDFGLRDISCGPVVKLVVYGHRADQEDAWLGNDTAIRLGLWGSSKNRTYVTGTRRPSNGKPLASATSAATNGITTLLTNSYDKTNGKIFPEPGEFMEADDVIIRRAMNQYQDDTLAGDKMDDSVTVRQEDAGVVEYVMSCCSENNAVLINKVGVRTSCNNDLGDKFATRHGQKGTLGDKLRMENLPFSMRDGTVADVYGNIIGIASRLTDGHMSELAYSAYCIGAGEILDATLFDTLTQREQRESIVKKFESYGGHVCQLEGHIHGETGKIMQPLLVGYITMMKLRHMVIDKQHARGFGPKQFLTRHPTEGRSLGGGHRFGYMERDNTDALGASEVEFERLAKEADSFEWPFCEECKVIAEYNADTGAKYCRVCMSGENVNMTQSTYTTKLAFQELFAMMMNVRPTFTDHDDPISYIPKKETSKKRKREDSAKNTSSLMRRLSTIANLEPCEWYVVLHTNTHEHTRVRTPDIVGHV